MFFQVYGANALSQWGMMIVVLLGLILLNEFARRTKLGGSIMFFVLTVQACMPSIQLKSCIEC